MRIKKYCLSSNIDTQFNCYDGILIGTLYMYVNSSLSCIEIQPNKTVFKENLFYPQEQVQQVKQAYTLSLAL